MEDSRHILILDSLYLTTKTEKKYENFVLLYV